MAAFEVELPRNTAFGALDLGDRGDAELDAVEKGRR